MSYDPATSVLQNIADAAVSKYFYKRKVLYVLLSFEPYLLSNFYISNLDCQFRNFVGHTGAYQFVLF